MRVIRLNNNYLMVIDLIGEGKCRLPHTILRKPAVEEQISEVLWWSAKSPCVDHIKECNESEDGLVF